MGFIDVRNLTMMEPKAGWRGRFFHSEHMTFAYYEIEPGASLPAHSHANEEVWHVLEGEVEVRLGDERMTVAAGDAVIVPAGATHAVDAKNCARAIVVDYPVRREVAGKKI